MFHGCHGPRTCVLGDGGLVLREGRVLRPQRSRAPQGELLARTGGGRPRPEGPRGSVALRVGAVGRGAEDGHPAGPHRRGRAPAPPGLGHHVLGAEVGLAGSAGDGGRACHPGARRGGAGDSGLDRAGSPADPGLGSGDEAPAAGEGGRHGGGRLSPPHQPGSRSPASHPLRSGEHDALRRRDLEERRADVLAEEREADRRALPQRTGVAAGGAGIRGDAEDDRPGSGLRAGGLRRGVPGCLLRAPPGDPGVSREARPAGDQGGDAEGDAPHAPAQGRGGSRRTGAAVARPRPGPGPRPRRGGAQTPAAGRSGDGPGDGAAGRSGSEPHEERTPPPAAVARIAGHRAGGGGCGSGGGDRSAEAPAPARGSGGTHRRT